MSVIGTLQAKRRKHITEMACCCGLKYRRWRFAGKPFSRGQKDVCAVCRKPIKYVANFKVVRPTTSVRRPNPCNFNRPFHRVEQFVTDDRPREGGRVLPLIPV